MQMSSNEEVMSRHLPVMVEEYSSLVQKAISKGAAGGDTEGVKLQPAVRMVTFTLATKAFLGDLLTRQELEQLFPEVCKFGAGALSLVRVKTSSGLKHMHSMSITFLLSFIFSTVSTIRMLQDFGLEDGIPFTPYWESTQSRKFIMSLLETKIATAITSGDLDASTTLGRMHARGTQTGLLPEGKEAALLAQEAVVLMFAGAQCGTLLRARTCMHPGPWPVITTVLLVSLTDREPLNFWV